MSQDRAALLKSLKAVGFKARRGHLRLQVGDLFWYVDPLLDGVGSSATLRLEVGCWVPELPPEPDGGAVDCPLLMDVAAGDLPQLLEQIRGIGSLAALSASLGHLPGALVDQRLRALL